MKSPLIEPLEARIAPAVLSIAAVQSQKEEGTSATVGGVTTFSFVVTLSESQNTDVTLKASIFQDIGDLAVAGEDFISKIEDITIPAGTTQKTISFEIKQDNIFEANETFTVALSDPSAGHAISSTAGSAKGTITNDDPMPTVSVIGGRTYEGDSGTSFLTFTVKLSNPADQAITFNWKTIEGAASGQATAGEDYIAQGLTAGMIPANASEATFTVPINGDTTNELEEYVLARIQDAKMGSQSLQITTAEAQGKIQNDDITVSISGNVVINEANSGTQNAQFTVTLSAVQTADVTVTYKVEGTGANPTSDADFNLPSVLTVVIPAGATTAFINIPVKGDTTFENTETFKVTLTDAVHAKPTTDVGTGTIIDNDIAPIVSILPPENIQANEGSVASGKTDFKFRVVLNEVSGKDVVVMLSTEDGTATVVNGDYDAMSDNMFTIPAGQLSKEFTVKVNHDLVWETNETFTVKILGATGATVGTNAAQATIVNDDPLPTLFIDDTVVTEGASGDGKFLTFTVRLSSRVGEAVAFDWSTVLGGTATPGVDYQAVGSTTATIPANQDSVTITVPIIGDSIDEPDETVLVNVVNARVLTPNGGSVPLSIGDGSAVGTIQNDDITVQINTTPVLTPEGNSGTTTAANFTVSLSQITNHPVDVYFTITGTGDNPATGGVANSNSDFRAPTITKVTIPAGQLSTTISVDIFGDDIYDGGDETYQVKLTSSSGAVIATGADTGVGIITQDDAAPVLTIAPVQVTEGNTGVKAMIFVVKADRASDSPITFDWSTIDGTALGGNVDFQSIAAKPETLAAFTTEKNLTVNVISDTVFENDETFTIQLANAKVNTGANGVTVNNPTGTGTITNDDALPQLKISDATVVEGNGGTPNKLVFTVTLVNTAGNAVTAGEDVIFDWATSLGTATPNVDYTSVSSANATIIAGQTSVTIEVDVLGDTTVETDETLVVNLANAHLGNTPLTLADGQGLGTIQNDDLTVSLNPAPVIVEGDTGTQNAIFTVTLSQASSFPVTFTFNLLDGTAKAGFDYSIPGTQTVTFAPNQTTAQIVVPILGDRVYEPVLGGETFTVQLTSATNAVIGTGSVVASITDNDPQPQLSIGDASVEEGDAGTKVLKFTVSLVNPTTGELLSATEDVTFDWSTADGSALSASDYTAVTSTQAKIIAGQTSVEISVTIKGDLTDEVDEQFFVNIANGILGDATPLGLKKAQATGTIENDDATVRISGGTIVEGSAGTSNFNFVLSLLQASAHDVVVTLSLANGTAVAGSDYQTPGSLVVTIPAGQTTANFSVPIIGDTLDEADETFTATIVSATNAKQGVSQATATILDDDAAPKLTISSPTVGEGNSGDTAMTFTITLDAASGQPVTVFVSPQGGTATLGLDYTGTGETLTFAPGETSKTFTIQVKGDTLFEANETVNVVLSNPSGATIETGTGIGTITNDDAQPTISISDVLLAEGSGSGNTVFTFTITLSGAADQPVTFDLATLDGTALAGSDYIAKNQTLTIPAGQTSATFSVSVKQDSLFENDEAFFVNLTNATIKTGPSSSSPLTITDGQGQGTISNDDISPTLSIGDVSITEGANGTKEMEFTVTLSGPAGGDVKFKWNTADGTAISEPFTPPGTPENPNPATIPADYTKVTDGMGTIPAGQTSVKIKVVINGDTTPEADENFFINLSDATVATGANTTAPLLISDAQAEGKILNDDVSIAIADATVVEGTGGGTTAMKFIITVTGNSSAPITLRYRTEDGTATSAGAAADFIAIGLTDLVIPAGQATAEIVVQINKDSNYDLANSFKVILSDVTNAQVTDGEAVGTITDDDVKPTVSINNVTRLENADGAEATTTTFTFTVKLSHASDESITVKASTIDGTAKAGSDYVALALQEVTFAPGETEKTVVVTVNNDAIYEADETFTVALSDPTNASLHAVNFKGIGTIQQDTDALPTIKVIGQQVVEGANGEKKMIFTVQRTGATEADIKFKYQTFLDDGDTATPGTDYTDTSVTDFITMTPSETTKTIEVVIKGDTIDEADETFSLKVTDLTGATATAADSKAKGTILNDDLTVTLASTAVSVVEGNTGQRDLIFTVSLSSVSTHDVTVTYTLAAGTATEGVDYQVLNPLQITIPAGQTTAEIRVPVQGDTVAEANETLTLTLTGATQAVLGATNLTGTGTIINDDAAISIADSFVLEGNNPNGTRNMVFIVTLKDASTYPVTVHYKTETNAEGGYTATDGTDFIGVEGDLTFLPGETTKEIIVQVKGDTVIEGDEKFKVVLSDPKANGVAIDGLLKGTADGRIQDDEVFITISDATIAEGNSGTTTANFVISISPGSTQPVTVTLTTLDLTATSSGPNPDYVAKTQTITFAPNETVKTFSVTIIGDRIVESNTETFKVVITEAGGGQVIDGEAIGTITDSGDTTPPPTLSVSNPSVVEGTAANPSKLAFTVSISQPSDTPVYFKAKTVNGTAGSGDFTALPETEYMIPAGQTSITIEVSLLGDDDDEANETLTLEVSAAHTTPTGGTKIDLNNAVGTGTIINDDLRVSIQSAQATETNGTGQFLTFTVRLSSPAVRATTVNYSITPGTATAGVDYKLPANLKVDFAVGEQEKQISIELIGDTLDEVDETLTVTLTSISNGVIETASAVGTILDDDPAPTITVENLTLQEGAAANFIVKLSAPSAKDVIIKWYTESVLGGATPGDGGTITSTRGDYKSFTEQTLVIPAGSTQGTISIPTVDDSFDETDEVFNLRYSAADGTGIVNATNGLGKAEAKILANDLSKFSIGDAEVVEGNNGTKLIQFVVTRTAGSMLASTVHYFTANGSASDTSDYVGVADGLLEFAPGEVTKTISITVNGDTLNETDETFFVNLTNATNATIEDSNALGRIKNDEVTYKLVQVSNSLTVAEDGNTFVEFRIVRTGPLDLAGSVTYATVANDASGAIQATAGTDFVNKSGTVSFAAGSSESEIIRVNIISDQLAEGNETFKFKLTNATNGVISETEGEAVVTIDDLADRNMLPRVVIEDAKIVEGNSGTTNLVFKVKLVDADGKPLAAGGAITIDYSTLNGLINGAEAGTDFTGATNATITFTAGQTEQQISIPVLGDAVDESDETFNVHINSAKFTVPGSGELVGLTIQRNDAVGTILNDDLTISVDSVAGEAESNGTYTRIFTISIPQASDHEVRVTIKTKDGTAISTGADADFTAHTEEIVIPAGATTATFEVVIRGDAFAEDNETFTLEFSDPKGAIIADAIKTNGFQATILNDDAPPSLSIGDASVVEGDSGQINMIFTVSLTGAIRQNVTVDYATLDGTAKSIGALLDFMAVSGSLTFEVGKETTHTIVVPIYGDIWKELTETFTVQLSNAKLGGSSSGIVLADSAATGTIIDNGDTTLGVTITDARVVEGAANTTSKLTFTVETTAPVTDNAVTFIASTRAGTAQTSDFTPFANQSFTIPVGSSTATVEVTVIGDNVFEVSEFMFVDVKNITNATPATGNGNTLTGRGVILTDDVRIISPREFEYVDLDGDIVNVKFSKGTLDLSLTALSTTDFTFITTGSTVGGRFLQKIDLTNDGNEFAGANITITARPQILVTGEILGDGKASVGALESAVPQAGLFQFTSGVQLGKVSISGDLGRIIAGSVIRPNGVAELVVGSLGAGGNLPSSPVGGLASNASYVLGPIGKMTVNGDVIGSMNVIGDAINQIIPGGGAGKIGTLVVKGKLKGGSTDNSGQIAFTGSLGKVTLGGIEGGAGAASGTIVPVNQAFLTQIGSLQVLGDIVGGAGENSALVAANRIGSIAIGSTKRGQEVSGSIIGGAGLGSASILSLSGNIGNVSINGDLKGGAGEKSGRLSSSTSIGTLTINGDLQGGAGQESGQVFAATTLSRTVITGSLIGGTKNSAVSAQTANTAGSIVVGALPSTLAIYGNIVGGTGESSGVVVTKGYELASGGKPGNAASITIGRASDSASGNITGGSASGAGFIQLAGNLPKFTMYGDLKGGSANATGGLVVNGTLGKAVIKGSLLGGDAVVTSGTATSLFRSGFIDTVAISSLIIEGHIKSGEINGTGSAVVSGSGSISAVSAIANLQVLAKDGTDALIGNSKNPVVISSRTGIGNATFGGNVTFAEILAGYSSPTATIPRGTLVNAGATIGTIKVTGAFGASSIVAGVDPGGDGVFGTVDDQQAATSQNPPVTPPNQNLISRIASVVLGSVSTPANLGTAYGIIAEQVDQITIGGSRVALTKGAHNDATDLGDLTAKLKILEI